MEESIKWLLSAENYTPINVQALLIDRQSWRVRWREAQRKVARGLFFFLLTVSYLQSSKINVSLFVSLNLTPYAQALMLLAIALLIPWLVNKFLLLVFRRFGIAVLPGSLLADVRDGGLVALPFITMFVLVAPNHPIIFFIAFMILPAYIVILRMRFWVARLPRIVKYALFGILLVALYLLEKS